MNVGRRWRVALVGAALIAAPGCTALGGTGDSDVVEMRAVELDPPQALKAAIVRGDADGVAAALDAGADVNAVTVAAPALGVAAQRGDTDIAQMLIDAGANLEAPNAAGRAALSLAVLHQDAAMVDLLLAAGADPDAFATAAPWLSALNFAAHANQVDLLARLIEAGGDVDAATHGDATPLLSAVNAGQLEAVTWLVEHGADASISQSGWGTAREVAVRDGHDDIVAYFDAVGITE